MQTEVLQENFVRSVAAVSRFVAAKSSLPILSMILLKAKKGKLVLVATDMDTGIEKSVGARTEEEGGVVVPAKLLLEYVNLLPPGKVELKTEGGELRMKSGKNMAKIAGMEAKEFPEMPEIEKRKGLILKREVLSKVVRLVTFATLADAVRPVLSAVLFRIKKEGAMDVVATDGYRLSLLSGHKVNPGNKSDDVLIFSRVINEVQRLVEEEGVEDVKVVLDKNKKSMAFLFGAVKLVTKLVEGEFPNYRKILPNEEGLVFQCNREELLEAVKMAAVFAKESSNIVRWNFQKNQLIIKSNSVNVGEQETVVEGEMIKGKTGKIAFNSRFLLELLSSVSGEKVEFIMNDALQPGMFRSSEKKYVHVIMPVRVQKAE